MYNTRLRYLTLGTSWIYRPRLSSPTFGVALRIILAHTVGVTWKGPLKMAQIVMSGPSYAQHPIVLSFFTWRKPILCRAQLLGHKTRRGPLMA